VSGVEAVRKRGEESIFLQFYADIFYKRPIKNDTKAFCDQLTQFLLCLYFARMSLFPEPDVILIKNALGKSRKREPEVLAPRKDIKGFQCLKFYSRFIYF